MEDRTIESNESNDSGAYEPMREWHDRQGVDARYGWSRVAPRFRRAPRSGWLGAALILCGIVPIGATALGYWSSESAMPTVAGFLSSNLVLSLVCLLLLAAGLGTLLTGIRKKEKPGDTTRS